MTPINQALEAALNDEVQLVDGDAEILFSELGFSEKFNRHAPKEIARQIIFYTQHLTHWIVAIYHSRSSDSPKCGFAALCFPKVKVPLLAFQALAVKLLDPPPEPVERREEEAVKPTEAGSDTLPLFRD